MIPLELRDLCDGKNAARGETGLRDVRRALELLNISPASELGQVAARYNLAMLTHQGPSREQLIDFCWPFDDIASAHEFIVSTWEIPDNFVPLTSCEGEGAYLYDRDAGGVWDFSLAERERFVAGECTPMFDSYFAFLTWYLGGNASPRT